MVGTFITLWCISTEVAPTRHPVHCSPAGFGRLSFSKLHLTRQQEQVFTLLFYTNNLMKEHRHLQCKSVVYDGNYNLSTANQRLPANLFLVL